MGGEPLGELVARHGPPDAVPAMAGLAHGDLPDVDVMRLRHGQFTSLSEWEASHESRAHRRTRIWPLGSLMHSGALPRLRQVSKVLRATCNSASTSAIVSRLAAPPAALPGRRPLPSRWVNWRLLVRG